jgi:hypothetical protein
MISQFRLLLRPVKDSVLFDEGDDALRRDKIIGIWDRAFAGDRNIRFSVLVTWLHLGM